MLSEIEDFVNWVRRRNPAARTWRDYSYDLAQFAALVGDRPPSEITHRDIDRFVNSQVSRGFKPATVNRRLAAILALFTYLADEDPTLICPVIPRRHFLRQPQRLPRPVKEDDLRAFFAVIEDARDRAMFILMLRCGLRIGEVANLLLADLYPDEPAPRLVVHGKGSRERVVYLSRQAEHALSCYLIERPPARSDFVFLSYQLNGLSTTAIHKRLMRYRRQAQVYLTSHRLRHTFANDLLSAGAPVTSIQVLLGHRWLETTQIYVQANDQTVQADYYAACLKLEGWSVQHSCTQQVTP
jgi:site-specific recombinase XerD